MRHLMRLTGNVLIAGCVIGLLALVVAVLIPEGTDLPLVAPDGQRVAASSAGAVIGATGSNSQSASRKITAGNPAGAGGASATSAQRAGDSPVVITGTVLSSTDERRPITRLVIPSIELEADVVQASLVPLDGGFTWQVPAFKVGHAETTAGAGQIGNAVLLGHVTSLHSGNVFQDLDRVQVGDMIHVFSDADQYDYTVVSTSSIRRRDSSVLQPTDVPSVTLITCTGMWLPTIWDYTERLVVHAERSQ